jgi:hypothetical protein
VSESDTLAIEPGVSRTDEFVASDRLLTTVGGTIGVGTHERRVIDVAQHAESAAGS